MNLAGLKNSYLFKVISYIGKLHIVYFKYERKKGKPFSQRDNLKLNKTQYSILLHAEGFSNHSTKKTQQWIKEITEKNGLWQAKENHNINTHTHMNTMA